MKWYINMKIGAKLISGFVLVSLISAAMGIYGIYNLKSLGSSDTQLYKNMTVPLCEIGMISTEFESTRVFARDMVNAQTPEDIQENIDKIVDIRGNVDKLSKSFELTILSNEMKEAFAQYKSARVEFKQQLDTIIALAEQNRDAEAFALMASNGASGKASKAYEDSIDNIVTMQIDAAKQKSNSNSAQADRTQTVMLVIMILVTALSILIGIIIATPITRMCKKVRYMIGEMSQGHFGERLNANTKDELGQMAETMDRFADELQTKVVGVMNSISAGDVSMEITVKDEKDEINPAMKKTVETIRGLNAEVQTLIKAMTEGKLDVRGRSDGYSGSWKDMIEGINGLVDAFVAPINVTAEYVERISKGDIPDRITDVYYGDFNEIKNNLNNCIDIMNGLLREANILIGGAQSGQLDIRANAEGFSGNWEELVKGMNQMIENVAKPVKEVTAVMNEMTNGNMHVSVNGAYEGEFEVLSHAVNHFAKRLLVVIGEISRVLGNISEGDLTIDNVEVFKGDFVNVSNSLNLILGSLNDFMGAVNTASDQVSIGSVQVSDGSQALSQGATEQASSVEELTSAVTEVATKTKENASSANEVSDLTITVKESAEQGNRHMEEMLKAMEEINDSSNNISKIIKVIDDIAFQTNILALNAAVEAARAGQHGKGFAVVAEEVRNLAARSAEAAKDTTELIQGSIKKSSVGTDIANHTAKALSEIVRGITKTADIISGIARSSNEQAMGIAQINLGLTQVSQVIQNNAATAEESAASSEELSSQAEVLKVMVGKFRLRRESEMKLIKGGSVLEKKPNQPPRIMMTADEYDKY